MIAKSDYYSLPKPKMIWNESLSPPFTASILAFNIIITVVFTLKKYLSLCRKKDDCILVQVAHRTGIDDHENGELIGTLHGCTNFPSFCRDFIMASKTTTGYYSMKILSATRLKSPSKCFAFANGLVVRYVDSELKLIITLILSQNIFWYECSWGGSGITILVLL